MGWNVENSGCNSITGYKTKPLKHVRDDQLCKMHTLIGFSGKYTIKFALAVQNKKIIMNSLNNNNNMKNWAVSAMCQKPCLLFPISLILLGWMLLLLKNIWVALSQAYNFYVHFSICPIKPVIIRSIRGVSQISSRSLLWTTVMIHDMNRVYLIHYLKTRHS